MSNIKNSNLIAFSQSIEKFLKHDFHNIKESLFNAKDNIQDLKENLLINEDNIPVIELSPSSTKTEEAPEAESQSKEETPLPSSPTLIDYSRNIDEEPMRECILKKTDDKLYGDDLKMENKFDDKNMSIYGCKCYKDNKLYDYTDDKNISMNNYNPEYPEHSWTESPSERPHNSKPSWSEELSSEDFFNPMSDKWDNTQKKDKDKDKIKMLAEGKGTIANTDAESDEASPEISFKFFIGKKSNKYVGNICLVNYNEEILLISDDIECFNSTSNNKFVAIFHVEEEENETREIAVYGTTQVCNILPTLFVFSAPHCGETDTMSMGGSVTTGKIKIAKKDDK
ncbi:MAG TPA: hypothetical protein DG753_02195 [Clostridium sp.]|nr:hypothetical protein [Clostridium sp.]